MGWGRLTRIGNEGGELSEAKTCTVLRDFLQKDAREKWERERSHRESLVPLVERNLWVIIIFPSLMNSYLISNSETTFTCLFCHHDKSVTVKVDRKESIAQLQCKVCGQRFQGKVNSMSLPLVSCALPESNFLML